MRRIQKSSDKVQDCIKIAADLVNSLKEAGADGVLIATIGWEDKLGKILERVRL